MSERVNRLEAMDRDLISNSQKVRFFPLNVAKAKGSYIYDLDNKEYLDFMAGWAVAGLGYGNEEVLEAYTSQLKEVSFATLTAIMNEPVVDLADKLVSLVPGDFKKKVWFGMHGSDACDTLYKLAPLATGRPRMVSYIGGYHGQTGGSAALSGHTAQAKFPGGGNVTKVPYPNCYRCPFGQTPDKCSMQCLDYIENFIFKTVCPAEDVSAIIIEAMQSDGGDIPAPKEYLPALEDMCRRHGILLFLDEVKIGLGRSGKMFSFEHYGITPDGVALGKSLGAGYVPVSAVVARQELLDAGTAINMYTLAGSPGTAAAARATIREIENRDLVAESARKGAWLIDELKKLQAKHPLIGDVRGLGLMVGVELVTDRESKTPAAKETAKVAYRAWELGLILFYGGIYSNVLEITPPLTISDDQLAHGLSIIDQALTDVAAGRVSDDALNYAGW
ncbi:MAG: aminotransferase class-III [Cohnella sp.]|jgi:4-aminobutyrate aminotransferase|nr:aminotransferase class-III [Cohnella sp.]